MRYVRFQDMGQAAKTAAAKLRLTTSRAARRVDKVSRLVFPLTFFIFNAVFWTYYYFLPSVPSWQTGPRSFISCRIVCCLACRNHSMFLAQLRQTPTRIHGKHVELNSHIFHQRYLIIIKRFYTPCRTGVPLNTCWFFFYQTDAYLKMLGLVLIP